LDIDMSSAIRATAGMRGTRSAATGHTSTQGSASPSSTPGSSRPPTGSSQGRRSHRRDAGHPWGTWGTWGTSTRACHTQRSWPRRAWDYRRTQRESRDRGSTHAASLMSQAPLAQAPANRPARPRRRVGPFCVPPERPCRGHSAGNLVLRPLRRR
jgi:hypothetical protein